MNVKLKFSVFVLVIGWCQSPTVLEAQSTEKSEGKIEVLFDGTSLQNFRGYQSEQIGDGWSIVDGTLMFDGSGSDSGGQDIITKKQYRNFELSFDWKVGEGANSGVMYRVTTGDDAPYLSGPEYQILDDDRHQDGKQDLTSAASLYGLYAPENRKLNPVGGWNSAKIVINGQKLEHWLNGQKVVSAEIGGMDWKKRVEGSKFKDWKKFAASETGHICFQDHGDKIWLRDIQIKVLE